MTVPKSTKEKMEVKFEHIKKQINLEKIARYAQKHTLDSIAYIILLIGLITSFFHPFYGGLVVGVLWGLYFSSETIHFLRETRGLVDEKGIAKSLIGGGALLALFVMAPGIIIGAAVGVGVKLLLKFE